MSPNAVSSLFLFSILLAGVNSGSLRSPLDKEAILASNCGGTFTADEGTLRFPSFGEEVIPGDVCVWTIHLQTKSDFRMNFTELRIPGNNTDCDEGAIRLYSLINLPEVDRESHTFCNEHGPPDRNFVLPYTVITVVFRVSEDIADASNVGFTLNWHGTGVDDRPTRHVSNFLTTDDGVIRYPVVGGYVSNLAATWLIKSPLESKSLQVKFDYAKIEPSCPFTQDPCLCDAIIIYQVSAVGTLSEIERICSASQDISFITTSGDMLIGLFTDARDNINYLGGFSMSYFENTQGTAPPDPETTTTGDVTTSRPDYVVSEQCGDTLRTTVGGRISYKADTNYGNNERCVWTIRFTDSSQINFKMVQGTFERGYDGLSISTFKRIPSTDELNFHNFLNIDTTGESEFTMNGSFAIITFHSDQSTTFNGFILDFEGNFANIDINPSSVSFLSAEDTGTVAHPANEGDYNNFEVSAFVFPPPSFLSNPNRVFSASLTKRGMESNCYDYIKVYDFSVGGTPSLKLNDTLCAHDFTTKAFSATANMHKVFMFVSDHSYTGTGFTLNYSWS